MVPSYAIPQVNTYFMEHLTTTYLHGCFQANAVEHGGKAKDTVSGKIILRNLSRKIIYFNCNKISHFKKQHEV